MDAERRREEDDNTDDEREAFCTVCTCDVRYGHGHHYTRNVFVFACRTS